MTHDEEDLLRHEAEIIHNLIKASDVKVIHKEYPVFEESNEWQIIDMGDGAKAVFHTASIDITECSCGYKSKSPFDILNHLVKVHGKTEEQAIALYNYAEEDQSLTVMPLEEAYKRLPKDAKIISGEEETM